MSNLHDHRHADGLACGVCALNENALLRRVVDAARLALVELAAMVRMLDGDDLTDDECESECEAITALREALTALDRATADRIMTTTIAAAAESPAYAFPVPDRAEANTLLMSAAPDLLNALAEVLKWMDACANEQWQERYPHVRRVVESALAGKVRA